MPIEKGDFLYLIPSSYEDKLRNKRCVCKKLQIFAVRNTLFSGKVLHSARSRDRYLAT
jgi:hypothetical protein